MNRQIPIGMRVAGAIGAMVLTILLSIFFITRGQVGSTLEDLVEANTMQIAEARADEVNLFISQYQKILKTLVSLDIIKGISDHELEVYAESLIGKVGEDVANVFLLWPDGRATTRAGEYVDSRDRVYYQAIFEEGRDSAVGNPILSRNTGMPAVILVQALADDSSRNVRAALAFEMSLEQISRIVEEINVGETSYGWVMDNTGLIIASPVKDTIMTVNISEGDEEHGYRGMTALSKEILANKQASGEFTRFDGIKYRLFANEISPEYKWRLGIMISSKELNEPQQRLTLILILIMIFALMISLGAAAILGRWISTPIKKVAAHFRDLAEGEADLTKRLEIIRNDEIGTLVTDFNVFLEKLSKIISDMKTAQEEIKESGQKLGSETEEAGTEVEKITNLAETIQVRLQKQTDNIDESSSAVNKTSNGIMSLDNLIVDQSSTITEASASIEQMVGNIGSVSNSTDRIASEFQALLNASTRGLSTQNAAMEKIKEISEQSENLLEANTAIGAIAAQTNLLAMNAAIEAAHAGEAGRGFSVVADEIRRLAETASAQSKTIGGKLNAIQESIEAVVKASADSEKAFEDLNDKIGLTDSLVAEVRSAMVEQKEGSEQILLAIKNMNEITVKVRTSSNEMSMENRVIVEAMDKLNEASREIYSSSEEIVRAVSTVDVKTHELSGIASQNRELVDRMEGTIGRFRV
ncbi:methyl-accepting chemotaxis protein [Treponema sp. OttesenSCG-928-L16]|nr:methyl-accepting chemotaxis protein [Treponema sp. OttesenSCG-928-L16]